MNYKTPYFKTLRFRWYRLVEREKRGVSEVCQLYGIPRKTYYKWYAHDHGRLTSTYRPHQRQPRTKLTPSVRQFIELTKLKTNYGPAKMALAVKRQFGLTVSATIIYRYYQRKMLIRRPQKRLPWYDPMKGKLLIKSPGEGVQLDVKYVYINGVRQCQFSVLDPYTRRYYARVFPTRESKNAVTAFRKAETVFGFVIHSVQTDNGSEFRGAFHRWLTKKHITHYFIPKSSPYWNAEVERVHKTVDDEYYLNPQRSWRSLAKWLTYYNEERLHLGLNGLTPYEKTLKSVTP